MPPSVSDLGRDILNACQITRVVWIDDSFSRDGMSAVSLMTRIRERHAIAEELPPTVVRLMSDISREQGADPIEQIGEMIATQSGLRLTISREFAALGDQGRDVS